MRFYNSSLCTYLILFLAWTEPKDCEQQDTSKKHFDKHYKKQQSKSDKESLSFANHVLLYSRVSGHHVQILNGLVNAKASADSEHAHLVLETDSFGKIRIKGFTSNRYICINHNGDVISMSNEEGKKENECIFQETYTGNRYTQFFSNKYQNCSLGFRKTGAPKPARKIHSGNRAIRFVKLAWIEHEKKRHRKRNISDRKIKKIIRNELRRKRRRRERQRRNMCFRSSNCLARYRNGRLHIKHALKCNRIFLRKSCR